MNTKSNKIKCHHCGEPINVNQVLSHQLEDELERKYNRKLVSERAKLEKAVEQEIQEKTVNLEESLKKKAKEEHAEEVKALEKELKEKSDQVKELHKSKAEIERLKLEKDEMEGEIELKAQKKIAETVSEEKAKIKRLEEEKAKRKITEVEFKISEKDQIIQQQQVRLKDMQQRLEQCPVQSQGEAQELAIEEWLKDQFPRDAIEEIKKGQSGADCLQTVRNSLGKNCGTIYYESKRTKAFQKNWIDKFNADIREKKADIGVLITQTMPKGMDRFGLKEGIWICSFDEFKGLCHVFRNFLIRISKAVVAQENKEDKMAMLYNYLTSPDFQSQFGAVVESYKQMGEDLEAEKRAMQRLWKKRENQIGKALDGLAGMYGAIEGIAGNAIQPPASLELPAGDEEYDNDD